MSKGSKPRPYSVSQEQFGSNYDAIFGKKDRREVEDAAAATVPHRGALEADDRGDDGGLEVFLGEGTTS